MTQDSAPRGGRDWTLKEQLTALAAFDAVFRSRDFTSGQWIEPEQQKDMNTLGLYERSEQVEQFVHMAYAYGWVRNVDWSSWRNTPDGQRLMSEPTAIDTANADDLAHVITTCTRADRFSDGYLAEAIMAGLIPRVATRAAQLLAELGCGSASNADDGKA